MNVKNQLDVLILNFIISPLIKERNIYISKSLNILMKDLFKKRWFWLILILLIALIVFFFVPIKGCGLLGGTPGEGTPRVVYITYFDYLVKGCPVG